MSLVYGSVRRRSDGRRGELGGRSSERLALLLLVIWVFALVAAASRGFRGGPTIFEVKGTGGQISMLA